MKIAENSIKSHEERLRNEVFIQGFLLFTVFLSSCFLISLLSYFIYIYKGFCVVISLFLTLSVLCFDYELPTFHLFYFHSCVNACVVTLLSG